MELEAPVDAWYVYVAVVIITIAFAGIALGITSLPPPDAQQAANTIEGTTGSEYTASSSYEHDAETVTVDHQTLTMENEYGTAHASFSYGTVVPVNGDERLENLVYGASFEEEFEAELEDPQTDASAELFDRVAAADAENTGEELYADGEIRVRTIPVEADEAVGIEARTENNDALASDLADESDDIDESDDVEIPGEVRLRTHGEAGGTNVHLYGTELTETIDVEDSDNWFADTVTGFTCSVVGWWCSDEPDIEPIEYTFSTYPALESGTDETMTLVEGDIEEIADTEAEEIEIWAGTYDLTVEVNGPEFDDCEAEITAAEEWTTICGPDLELEDFDDPHWHDDSGGVHYVTLVMV